MAATERRMLIILLGEWQTIFDRDVSVMSRLYIRVRSSKLTPYKMGQDEYLLSDTLRIIDPLRGFGRALANPLISIL